MALAVALRLALTKRRKRPPQRLVFSVAMCVVGLTYIALAVIKLATQHKPWIVACWIGIAAIWLALYFWFRHMYRTSRELWEKGYGVWPVQRLEWFNLGMQIPIIALDLITL